MALKNKTNLIFGAASAYMKPLPPFYIARFTIIIWPHILKLRVLLVFIACFSCNSHYSDKEIDATFERANGFLKQKGYPQALRIFDSLNQAVSGRDGYFQFKAYSFLKEYYYYREMPDSNKAYNDSIIYVIDKFQLSGRVTAAYADALNNKGNRYFEENDLRNAFDYYYRSNAIAIGLKDTCLISDQAYHLGMVCYRQERFGEAVKYFKQALSGNDACNDEKMSFYRKEELYTNVGLSYSNLQAHDSALRYYQHAMAYVEGFAAGHSSDTDITKFARVANGVIYANLATEFMASYQFGEAEVFLKKAVTLNSSPQFDTLNVTFDRLELARIAVMNNRLSEAAYLLKQVDSVVGLIPVPRLQKDRSEIMYEYYKKVNNPLMALQYLEMFNRKRDSSDNRVREFKQNDFPQILKDRETQYVVSLLKKDNEVKQLYLWLTIGLIVLAVVIVVLMVTNYRRTIKSVAKLTALNKRVREQKVQQDKTMAALVESNRDMDRILHVVAHDLRSPVSAIMMMTGLMADEIEDPSHKEIMEMIVASSKSQLALIGELLQFSGSEVNEEGLAREAVDMNELCKQAASMLYFKAGEKRQHIDVTFAPGAVMVSCVKEKMNRVINNLVTNAIKFSSEGGVIHIRVQRKEATVVIEIKDNGIGIPEKNKAILFDSFTNAKRPGTSGEKSFGLGLSICKQIVEAQGGKIWFESEEGKGSTFFIELPLA